MNASTEPKTTADPIYLCAPSAPDFALLLQCFEQADLGTAIFDTRTHRIRYVNPAFARDRGYRPEQMRGLSVDALYPSELVAERQAVRAIIDAGTRMVVETEQVTRDGRRFPVRLNCTVLRDVNGQPETVIVYAADITAERRATRDLRLAAAAFEAAQPMEVIDAHHRIVRINGSFTGLTGYQAKDAVGLEFPILRNSRNDRETQQLWDRVAATGGWQRDEWIRTKDGDTRIVHRAVSAVHGPDGAVAYYVCSLHDLTREHGALANLDRLTFFDTLTGLPNRAFLCSQLRRELPQPVAAGARLLLLMDLDQFKRINEVYGHASGDHLLAMVARRLQRYQGEHGLVCRLEGDTFAWLTVPAAGQSATVANGSEVAERLHAMLQEPFDLDDGTTVNLTACVGWTEVPSGSTDPDALLEAAALALGAAKIATGAGRTCNYTPDMHVRKQHQESLIRELQAALVGDGLSLHPQLQVDRSGRAIGAEVLLRWTRSDGEQVPPSEFIPLATQGRLLEALDMWVLDHTCALLADWAHKPMLADLTLAANVSAWRFQQPGFVGALQRRLHEAGADPRRLQLEITETAALGDFDVAADKLHRLRALGVRISLDDFGIGYSSMGYLAHLPLDQLKIDQSFVAQVPLHPANTVLVEAIIAMAHGFNLEVVAEGVETRAQQTFLQAHGCDVFQGYLYARPAPVAEVEALVLADAAARACRPDV